MINPAFLSTTYVQIFMATSRIVIIRGHCIYILSCPFKRILSLVFFIIPSLTAFLKRTLHARSKAALQIYFAVIELLYHPFLFYSTIKNRPGEHGYRSMACRFANMKRTYFSGFELWLEKKSDGQHDYLLRKPA